MIKLSGRGLDLNKEWILTNGLEGCWFSSTVKNVNTRKYHGLALNGRIVLNGVEELVNGRSLNQKGFVKDYYAGFEYESNDIKIKKRILMPFEKTTAVIKYEIISKSGFELVLRPWVNDHMIHFLNHGLSLKQFPEKKGFKLSNGFLAVVSDGEYSASEKWRDVDYSEEAERGYESKERIFSPGFFKIMIKRGINEFELMPGFEKLKKDDFFLKESKRIKKGRDKVINQLLRAADSFVVRKNGLKTIVAGYHFFDDYGRDAMISLPGLLLVTGRFEDAKRVLLHFAGGYYSGEVDHKHIKSVDAPLWFVYAVYKFVKYSEDYSFVRKELWSVMRRIVSYFERGYMRADYLLENGPVMSWMDTQFTPRVGKLVEVNALWFNALKVMEFFCRKFEEDFSVYVELSEGVRKNFDKVFWNREKKCFKDTSMNLSVRPNQLFAVSLPFPVSDRRMDVLRIVRDELLIPNGVRSLSPDDDEYVGVYEGDQFMRDQAYHNGTGWVWLLGFYINICPKNEGFRIVNSLLGQLGEAGVGSLSEICDGDEPYTLRGCISQAWSVAELLRSYHENLRS